MPYIPQQRKLGVFSHSKNFGAGRSRQNPDFQRNRFRSKVLKQGSKARFPSKVPKQFQSNSQASFPSKLPKQASKRFPKTGFQARFLPNRFPRKVPKQGSQARFPRSASKVPKARLPGTGSHWFLKVPKNRKVPKQGIQEKVQKVPRNRFPWVPKQNSQETAPKQGSQERFRSKVPRNRFPSKVTKNRFPRTDL